MPNHSKTPSLNLFDAPSPSADADGNAGVATPMMAQYLKIKRGHPDHLLFYRMGDFYELFFDDAVRMAGLLDITLTKRGKHLGEDIPMCGVPVVAVDNYLHRLLRAGLCVAVAEQVGEAGGKLMMRRVVRVLTPGTLTEEALLGAEESNLLVSVNGLGVAWCDISTGLFRVKGCADELALLAELGRLAPKEIIIAEGAALLKQDSFQGLLGDGHVTPVAKGAFNPTASAERLKEHFGWQAAALEKNVLGAAGAMINYLELTQMESLGQLQAPLLEGDGEIMMIDPATRTNLELTQPLRAGAAQKKATLFAALNETKTSAGARKLRARLQAPLCQLEKINGRLDEVAFFLAESATREKVQEVLKQTPDMARALARISFGRAAPRDFAALRDGLVVADGLVNFLRTHDERALPANIQQAIKKLNAPPPLVRDELVCALADSMPATLREGGMIREGFDAGLDQQRQAVLETRRQMNVLQKNYAQLTKIKGLKIKYNSVLGFFVEVSAAAGQPMLAQPLNETFIHRQTLANSLRFSTQDLSDLASAELKSQAVARAQEKKIVEALAEKILESYSLILDAADAKASLDVAAAVAALSARFDFTRPLVDDSQTFSIEGGRHFVVERALASQQLPFMANPCHLDRDTKFMWLLTGPNMAGKSTFLRQNAIIAVMAQAGLFVPATFAHIGLIDKLFSRIGAADNLAFGQSTFMVEMVETATILTQATKKSFVIVDEIGRGTATYDGLALAWAIVEFMCEKLKCRALFATHFHELTHLEDKLGVLANYHMKTARGSAKGNSGGENKNAAHLLYEVGAGAARHSYGIEVARLAGLPQQVIGRATDLLESFESTSVDGAGAGAAPKEKSAAAAVCPPALPLPQVEKLRSLNLDQLTPRQAWDLLLELQQEVADD